MLRGGEVAQPAAHRWCSSLIGSVVFGFGWMSAQLSPARLTCQPHIRQGYQVFHVDLGVEVSKLGRCCKFINLRFLCRVYPSQSA
jgi:hypothetical protein